MGMHTHPSVVNVIEIKNTLYRNCTCSGGGWWGGGGIGIEVFNWDTALIERCTICGRTSELCSESEYVSLQ